MLDRKHQIGLTLIELMIGMLLGIIVMSGAIKILSTSITGQSDNLKLARINQDLRAMIDIMARDIRRAGFVTSSPDIHWQSLQKNPFFINTNSTDITLFNNGQCILYSYNRHESNDADADGDGLIDVLSNERLGFKLNSHTHKLKMRLSGTDNNSCSNGRWESITEPDVDITALQFTLATSALNVTSMSDDDNHNGIIETSDSDGIPYGDDNANGFCDAGERCNTCPLSGGPGDPACLYIRHVTIALTGQLSGDNATRQSVTERIRIRNDKFVAAIP